MIPRLATRFGLRERIWLTVVAVIAAVLLGLTAGFNVLVANRLSHDADNVAMARATAELDALKVSGTRVTLAETLDKAALDTPTWVLRGSRVLEAPTSGQRARAEAIAMSRRPRGFREIASLDLRLYGLPVLAGSHRVGTVVAAVSLAPYEEIKRVALLASSALAFLALVAIAAASRWMIAKALRPVSEMTRQAAEWSAHQMDRRFSLGEPRDEFTTLAATLDGLLDRVAASLRHEQNLTAELSHELRTPLTQITAEAQYALRHGELNTEQEDSFRRILGSARQLTRILDTLITAARAQARSSQDSCDATAAARAAINPFRSVAADAGIEIELLGPHEAIAIPFDAGVVERILAPLLENACRFAQQRVSVEIAGQDSEVTFIIHDDGPGIRPEHAESVFEPGFRSKQGGVALLKSAGLGLALARRLAQGLGGDVRVVQSDGGARILVSLPSA
jgi:two-component system, OmpR family, sensor kinase